MSYDMECCYGDHEDFSVITSCEAECGRENRSHLIVWCGDESVPRRCRCGASLNRTTAR